MNNCKSCSINEIIVTDSDKTRDCEILNTDPIYDTGNCPLDENGNPVVTPLPVDTSNNSCITTPSGLICPVMDQCSPWDLTESPEACLISDLIDESLQIGGAVLNVYRLLGIHEQGSLQDLIGAGTSFSNGFLPNYSSANAFDKFITEWRSLQLGSDVIKSAFIGYDFGPIKLNNGRNKYGIETAIKHDISRINIKQACDAVNRVTKIRIERSNDGEKWFGVAILSIPDCDGLITLDFPRSVPSRFWRLRPLQFNGSIDDYWGIQALQFVDYERTQLNNIQDKILLENRDRDYDEMAIRMKGSYTPLDVIANQTKFGFFQDADRYVIETSFTGTIRALGRPIVIGDIIQLPSETQYTPTLAPVLKYLEVVDVSWSVNGYTPTWVPTMYRIIAVPAISSQETQDLFGKLTRDVDNSGLVDIDNGNNLVYQDNSDISQTISADANTMVPERGEDTSQITQFSSELLKFSDDHPHMNIGNVNRKRNGYAIDAMPPNGESYTEGDVFPVNPANGAYHRLTYKQTVPDKDIPPRLYRFSSKKLKWIYLETDRRYEARNTKPRLQEFLDPDISSVTPPFNAN